MKKQALSLLLVLVLMLSAAAGVWADPYDFDLQFTDVSDNDTFYEAVVWAVQEGVTSGTSDTTFSPGRDCTRGQVVTFLWRAKGCPEPKSEFNPFTDVAPGSYCEQAVLWAVENAVTSGTSEDRFSPDEPCTWGHIITFLWRANGKPEPLAAGITEAWADSWYRPAVAWADSSGILGVDRDGFNPAWTCNRGTTVTWLYRDAVKTVSTVSGLLDAVATGRIIYLEAGTYNLTEWAKVAVMEERFPAGNYVTIDTVPDGYEVRVQNAGMLRLRAAPGAEGKVELIAEPRYAEVLTFKNCGVVEMTGMVMGHMDTGFCQGGVLKFDGCESVYLDGMDLYGCGTYGIESRGVERLTVKNSVIRECSYGIMEFYNTTYAQFEDCSFHDCREYTMLTVNHSAVSFDHCVFKDNYWGQYGSFLALTEDEQTIVMFSDCELSEFVQKELKEKLEAGAHIVGVE